MSTEAPVALRADACPEPEQLAAYIDGGLPPAERTTVERHLVGCADCRDVVGETVRTVRDLPSVIEVAPSRWKRLTVAGGVLAAAAAVVLMVRLQQPSLYYVPEMAGLVKATGETRPITARLTGGFAYAPPPSPTRGAGSQASIEVAGAAEAVRAVAARTPTPSGDAALGVANVFLGDLPQAVVALRKAAASGDSRILSDLSAVLLAEAERTGSNATAKEALDAADAAVRDPNAPIEAFFNRALALEALPSPDAPEAWRTYLARDSNSDWAAEARLHLERLTRRD
jgi:anti-sigma factor RsiW